MSDADVLASLRGELEGARAEIAQLREQIARRDVLIRQAGETLVRDSGEVVRVFAELEKRESAIKADLQQALRFQRAILAPLPQHDDVTFDAVHIAAEIISGDFYDVSELPETGIVRVFVADATGHGIAAGLATMFIKGEYEAHKRVATSPAEMLSTMNERLASRYANLDLRCTGICLDYHRADRTLRYSCAAHPAPILVGATGTRLLPTGGSFLGMIAGVSYPLHDVTLSAGDVVVAYTDGLTDATAPDGAHYGDGRMLAAVEAACRDRSSICANLVHELSSFVGEGNTLADDVAIVTFSVAR